MDEDLGIYPLCWLKYDDLKNGEPDMMDILKEEKIVNRENHATKYSYQDWFEKRMFYSYVYKISDQGNMSISGKAGFKDNPEQAMMEAERLKNQLQDYDEEQWER